MGSQSAGIGSALPDQNGQAGNILTTDGTVASWEVSSSSLPSQGGNSGKFLTTNGTVASWASVSASLTVGTFSATSTANAADITAGVLTLHATDGTNPGCVVASTQNLGDNKTIGTMTFKSLQAYSSVGMGWPDGTTFISNSGNPKLTLGGSFNELDISDGTAFTTRFAFVFHGTDSASNCLDMTGCGKGASIKLKSPDGTTWTATMANGGTWSIS